MDDIFVEGRTSDSAYDLEVMPYITKKRRVCDLAGGDTQVLLHTLEEFELQLEDVLEDLPVNFTSGLQQLRKMLEDTGVERIEIDRSCLRELNIRSGPLLLSPDVIRDVKNLGASVRDPGRELSMEILGDLIRLVRHHVSLLTDSGCRTLINVILLRVVSAMSTDETDVNIIPEFPIPRTSLQSGFSFTSDADLLITKLPSRSTRYLLLNPTSAIETIDRPITTIFYVARQDRDVRAAVPQAVLAVAAYCKAFKVPLLRGGATNGEKWIFFVYSANVRRGGRFSCSDEFSLGQELEGLPLILGLLTDWVDNATSADQKFFTYK